MWPGLDHKRRLLLCQESRAWFSFSGFSLPYLVAGPGILCPSCGPPREQQPQKGISSMGPSPQMTAAQPADRPDDHRESRFPKGNPGQRRGLPHPLWFGRKLPLVSCPMKTMDQAAGAAPSQMAQRMESLKCQVAIWRMRDQSCDAVPKPPAFMKLLAQHQDLKKATGLCQVPATPFQDRKSVV